MLDQRALAAITALTASIRPDWTDAGIRNAVTTLLADYDAETATRVALAAARDPVIRTPAALPLPGPHHPPKPTANTAAGLIPYQPLPECTNCGTPARRNSQPRFCPSCGQPWRSLGHADDAPRATAKQVTHWRGVIAETAHRSADERATRVALLARHPTLPFPVARHAWNGYVPPATDPDGRPNTSPIRGEMLMILAECEDHEDHGCRCHPTPPPPPTRHETRDPQPLGAILGTGPS